MSSDPTKTINSEELEESKVESGKDPSPPQITHADSAESERSSAPSRRNTSKENASTSKGVTFQRDAKGDTESRRQRKMQSDESFRRRQIEAELDQTVVLPWTKQYKTWWGFSVFMSIMTIFFETYQIAFSEAGLAPHDDAPSIIGFFFIAVFVLDILVNFNLAYFDEEDHIVTDRAMIAKGYLKGMFIVDLIGVFPFYIVALLIAGEMGEDSDLSRYLALLRLFRLVRLHRVKQLFDTLQYNTHVSLTALTLTRNFGAALVWTHFAACVMYFIARQKGYNDEETWIGGLVYGQSPFERYVTALYWSVVTFTTVGYGDFSPVNPYEQIFGMMYMLLNMIIAAWMIGSITLLIVKTDEQTSKYRETLQTLDEYSKIHNFDRRFRKRLRTSAKLYFQNRQIADEEVLQTLPVSVRRKVLRKLYLPCILRSRLMKGIRHQFVDAFLSNCTVEVFSAGEEILSRGSASSDLYLLVEGSVKVVDSPAAEAKDTAEDTSAYETTSNPESDNLQETGLGGRPNKLETGKFINDVEFFTETPQSDTIRAVTVIKTLTLSLASYKLIAADHPASVGKILANLLAKVEEAANENDTPEMTLTKRLEVLQAGSAYDRSISRASSGVMSDDEDESGSIDMQKAIASIQAKAAVVACKDVIKMHIDKLKDDHTTRFLFAASRDNTGTIALMCDQGFNPNGSDYDKRNALMIACMKGNIESARKLLEYHADPNKVDCHGTSALYEAARNGHEEVMDLLLEHGAKLCMPEPKAALVMCQTVFDGDTVTLKRLLKARIPVNAADYDKRTAVHIACSEGNLVALKVLVENGASLSVRDRWNNTPMDDAKAAGAMRVINYLNSVMNNKEDE